jgi:hypothetical protein
MDSILAANVPNGQVQLLKVTLIVLVSVIASGIATLSPLLLLL